MSAVSVSGHGQVGEVADRPVGAVARPRGEPSATSIRTVSTAYSGIPSARATIARIAAASGRPGHEAGEQRPHGGSGESGSSVRRGEVALAGAPVRPRLEQLRAGRASTT